MRVTVEKDIIGEDLLVVREGLRLDVAIQHAAFTNLGPIAHGRSWVFYGVFILFVAIAAYCFKGFVGSLRGWRNGR